jgi:hypothetical protein
MDGGTPATGSMFVWSVSWILIDEKLGTFDLVGNGNFREVKKTIRREAVAAKGESECRSRRIVLGQVALHIEPIARS